LLLHHEHALQEQQQQQQQQQRPLHLLDCQEHQSLLPLLQCASCCLLLRVS
jgi:hypothetical protein